MPAQNPRLLPLRDAIVDQLETAGGSMPRYWILERNISAHPASRTTRSQVADELAAMQQKGIVDVMVDPDVTGAANPGMIVVLKSRERLMKHEEVRRFLRVRDAAIASDAADDDYPAARRRWIDAEKAVLPHLTPVGIVVGDRRVSVNCLGEVVVGQYRKFTRTAGAAPVSPKVAKTAGMERAARIGGVAW